MADCAHPGSKPFTLFPKTPALTPPASDAINDDQEDTNLRSRGGESPRIVFEKFAQADPTLTTQMKSVGEAMAIGRTFKESLPKCLRSLEIGRRGLGGDGKPWRIGTEIYGDRDILPRDVISRKLTVPNAERIFFIRHALRAGFTIEEIFGLTKIYRWFLVQIKEIVDFEEELATAAN